MKREIAFILLLILGGVGVWAGSARFQEDGQNIDQTLANPTPLPDPIDSPGNRFIADAAKMLASFGPVQARIRAEINLFDQTIRASGIYIQAGQGSPKTRTELRFGNGDESTYFVQIHDGRSLYTMSKGQHAGIDNETITGEKSPGEFYYVDLHQVDWENTKSNGLVAGPFGWSFVGGMAAMLDHCAVSMQFSDPQQVKLETMDAIEVTGLWRTNSIKRLLEGQIDESTEKLDWNKMPPHFPSGVKLTFSKPGNGKVAFPHRIEFFRYQQTNGDTITTPIATFELFELGNLKELPESTFRISAGDLETIDQSELYKNRVIQFTR